MKWTIYSLIFSICLLFSSMDAYSQKGGFANKIFGQDSTVVDNNTLWADLSFGPSFTLDPTGLGSFFFGPTIDITFIDHNYRLNKLKSSFHRGFVIFDDNPQYTWEFNFMTGKINAFPNHTAEFYYGLGLITGSKRVGIIRSGENSFFGGIGYEKKNFFTFGIPFEYKIQWSVVGIGIDGNLNPKLPYLGTKLYVKLGDRYRR